jgi:hypothetical protein
MEISQKALEEFKDIWRKQFGEEISDKDAYEEAICLLRLFKVIYRPLPTKNKKEQNQDSGPSCS